MATFILTANPDTDIWRKPPHIDVFNAPTTSPPGTTTPSSGPLSSFRSAKASFSFNWTEQYDQAGLVLSFRPSSSSSSTTGSPPRWIKTGVEYYNGTPMLSTVSCHKWADWSISPLSQSPTEEGQNWTTILISRLDGEQDQEKGASLWVHAVLPSGEKLALREICWVYEDGDDTGSENWTLEVKVMAARPNKTATTGLEVTFRDVVVEWA
ncbi:hypothetical protein V8F33_004801 [Rhypophila sp. PSN 637]